MKNLITTLSFILFVIVSITAQDYGLNGNLSISDTTTTGDMNIVNDIYVGSLIDDSKNPSFSSKIVLRDPVSGKLEPSTFSPWYPAVYPVALDCYNEKPLWASGNANELHIGSQCNNGVRIGIGTATPNAGLDVNGNARFYESVGLGILPNNNIKLSIKSSSSILTGFLIDTQSQSDMTAGVRVNSDNANLKAISVGVTGTDNFNVWGDGKIDSKDLNVTGTGQFSEDMAIGTVVNSDARLLVKPNSTNEVGLCVDAIGGSAWDYGVKLLSDNPDYKSFSVNDGSGDDSDKFVVFGDGRVESKGLKVHGNGGVNKVFQVINESSGLDVVRVLGNGNMWATAVHVRLSDNFPDYVFDADYELMSLHDLKIYISENNKLPNMPSAETVAEVGVDLGEMDRLLVEKVEELTLYILQMKKEIDELKLANQTLQNIIEK